MCNCGTKRNTLQQDAKFLSNPVTAKRNKSHWADIKFEYIGKTGLSVTGPITGRRYRFNFTGDIQLIDYRDANSVSQINLLKQLATEAV
jgi:hypothetical protein